MVLFQIKVVHAFKCYIKGQEQIFIFACKNLSMGARVSLIIYAIQKDS